MTWKRAYVGLGETGGPGGGGDDDPPPNWPPGWNWPPPPYPPGFGEGTYLGTTYKASTYSIVATFDQNVNLVVESYSGYDVYTGSTFSVSVSGGYRALYVIMDEGETLNLITSITLSGTYLTEAYLNKFTSLTTLDLSDNAGLTTINLSALVNLVTVDLGQCAIAGAFSMTNYTELTTLDVADNAITSIDFGGSSLLATIDISGNTITAFDLAGTAITSLDLTAFTTAATVDLTNCTALTSFDINAVTTLTSVTLTGCTALETLDGSSTTYAGWSLTGLTALTTIDLSSNTLGEGRVDDLLSEVAAFGTSNGNLDLCTNNPPTATGEADVTILEGRGWTVCVDEVLLGFSVYPQYNTERGTSANIIIQALDVNGDPDTTYTPSETLDLELTSEDQSDLIDVSTVETTGWSNGSKTVAGTISGGSGDDQATITVSGDGRTGTSSSFNIKDTVTSTPSVWRLTLLQSFSWSAPTRTIPNLCGNYNCAPIDYVWLAGVYENLIPEAGSFVPTTNIIDTIPLTSTPEGGGACTEASPVIISIRSTSVGLGIWSAVGGGESFYANPGQTFSGFDITSWATYKLSGVPRSASNAICMDPDTVDIIIEAIS